MASKLLGTETLLGKSGPVATEAALEGKEFVCLYFSANWCPPCHAFTPQLAAFYEEHSREKKFEVVFCSSDRDAAQFGQYFAAMPWLALPFDEARDQKAALSKKFRVASIPTLVILNASDGSLVTRDGREGISSATAAEMFPFRPPTARDVLNGCRVVSRGDVTRSTPFAELTKGKHVLLYFSAHWCPPCKKFTPLLAKWYEAHSESADVVYCSSDRQQSEFDAYFSTMPFAALPFSATEARDALAKIFAVKGIPKLVLLSPDLTSLVTGDGRACVEKGFAFPDAWRPKPFADLTETIASKDSDLNQTPALVVLADALDDDLLKNKFVDALQQTAERHAQNPDLLFYYATRPDPTVDRIRELTAAPPSGPTVLFLDIPDDGAFYRLDLSGVDDFSAAFDAFLSRDDTKGPRLTLGAASSSS